MNYRARRPRTLGGASSYIVGLPRISIQRSDSEEFNAVAVTGDMEPELSNALFPHSPVNGKIWASSSSRRHTLAA